MLEFVKDFFRRRALRKWSSTQETSLLPLSSVRSASVLMDVEDPSFEELQAAVTLWLKSLGIPYEIHYLDFRKLEKDQLLMTSIQYTTIRKDLNWYDLPPVEKVANVGSDLFLSLVGNETFPVRFYAECSRSRFKIGRTEGAFDLTVKGEDSLVVFEEMKKYLIRIA